MLFISVNFKRKFQLANKLQFYYINNTNRAKISTLFIQLIKIYFIIYIYIYTYNNMIIVTLKYDHIYILMRWLRASSAANFLGVPVLIICWESEINGDMPRRLWAKCYFYVRSTEATTKCSITMHASTDVLIIFSEIHVPIPIPPPPSPGLQSQLPLTRLSLYILKKFTISNVFWSSVK